MKCQFCKSEPSTFEVKVKDQDTKESDVIKLCRNCVEEALEMLKNAILIGGKK